MGSGVLPLLASFAGADSKDEGVEEGSGTLGAGGRSGLVFSGEVW